MPTPLTLSSVPAVAPSVQYIATDLQTVFPYPFPITQDADLVVVVDGVTLNTNVGYSLSGQGNPTGGYVLFALGLAVGTVVTLYRDIVIQRVSQIAQNSGFSSVTFNAEFNNIYLILQQLQDSINFCLQVPNSNSPAPVTTLVPSNYANKFLAFDGDGNPTAAVLTNSGILTEEIIDSLLTAATPAALAPLSTPYATTPAENAAGVTPVDHQYKPGDIRRYGASTASPDNTTAISAAIAQAQQLESGSAIYIPGGSWQGSWVFNGIVTGIKVYGDGMELSELVAVDSTTDVITFGNDASVWGIQFEDFKITGGLNGIHFPTGLHFPPFSCLIKDVHIINSASHGIYDEAACFTLRCQQVIVTGTTDHAFDLLGGNTTVLEGCYAQVVPVGTGKAGYRIHGGLIMMSNCNGVNTGDYWGIFGDTVADDGVLRYCSPTLDHCNVESFTVCGVLNKSGGVTLRGGTIFTSHLANNIALQVNPANTSQRGVMFVDTNFINTGGGWLNTYPIHTITATGVPFAAAFSPAGNDTYTYYDELVAAPATAATLTTQTVVAGVVGYGINDLYIKGRFRTAAGGYTGFFGKTPIVQIDTGVAGAAFTANAGTAVNDASTFGGYTLKQVVKALQNYGLLA